MHHDLKSWPANFLRLLAGSTAEVRKNDRSYALGDYVTAKEFLPTSQEYTGRTLDFAVKWVLTPTETPGIVPGFVVLVYQPIRAALELVPAAPDKRPDVELVFSVPGWMCDANPVMQMVEDVRGERHQLQGPEMNDAAGMGASGLFRSWADGRREFVIRKCDHEFVGMACVACGLPRSLAVI